MIKSFLWGKAQTKPKPNFKQNTKTKKNKTKQTQKTNQ
jgi:hypothetical protein